MKTVRDATDDMDRCACGHPLDMHTLVCMPDCIEPCQVPGCSCLNRAAAMTTDGDWIAAEREHEREMAEIAADERWRRSQNRKEVAGWVISVVAAVLIVGILAALIYWWVDSINRANMQRDIACYESGGTRVTIQNGPTLCLHLGEEVPR